MKIVFKNNVGLVGTVERRLFDKDGNAKKMFADNFIWRFLKKVFNVDIQIPFLTGFWTYNAIRHNLVTTVGKAAVADQTGGTTTSPMTALAIGIGTTAAAAADTTLESEITTNGGERGAAAVTNVTTTTADDTERWIKTWTFTGSFAVTEEGVLDNNTSGGVLLARQVFAAVNVVSGDSLQVTHSVQVTT